MNAQDMDWSDIPFVLAVCETGSLSGAAKKLGVNHSTVFRRIEGVEAKLGVTLFERLNTGYVMTVEGESFYQQGSVLKEGVSRIQRELSGHDSRLEGTLVITTTDSLLHALAHVFKGFQQKYPDIELRILTGTRHLDLVQRDADIALRPTLTPPEHWVGRNLLTLSYKAYAHLEYIKEMKHLSANEYRWIKLVENLNQSSINKMIEKLKDANAPSTIASSLMGAFELTIAGLGIMVLPCYVGDKCPQLVEVKQHLSEFDSELWILAHPDMRRSAKVHAFFEYATPMIKNELKPA
jgi:DNA-binding transcriptional LysR family regulator